MTGFKPGKLNPYSVLKAQLCECKEELQRERDKTTLRPFVKDLGQLMLTVLATTPYAEWPPFAKACFEHQAKQTPTTAWMYKERLPK